MKDPPLVASSVGEDAMKTVQAMLAEAEAAVPRAYCASGGRSALVGKTLKDMGYSNVRNLGGFKGWLEAGGDVEKA